MNRKTVRVEEYLLTSDGTLLRGAACLKQGAFTAAIAQVDDDDFPISGV
ncbi:hypothetical protein [Paraburkholderia phytofirmans]|nr:hypothetical protein [Paraburkholderia phytofirmans]